jgi:exopolyphosphatase/guanosine-5'-triphosphate,3'-diphosphate pyrophosphatase
MRVAVVDIGTNTVLLLIAERARDGHLAAVLERACITRLGAGVDASGRLSEAAISRTATVLAQFGQHVRANGVQRVAVVGTSAMRDAGSQPIRDAVRSAFGVEVRVLTGAEEASHTFRGALSGLASPADEVSVFDVGGGSTEVVLGHHGGSLSFAHSFRVGSVRLTERFIATDPPSRLELERLQQHLTETFAEIPPLVGTAPPVGIAGTVTTLAALLLGVVPYDGARVHGQIVSTSEVRRLVRDLAAADLAGRRALPGMEPGRADVVVAGGMIVLALLDHWGSGAMMVSDRGVRWGVAESLASGEPL